MVKSTISWEYLSISLLISHSLNDQHHFLVELSSVIHPSIPRDLTAVADIGTGTGYVDLRI